VRPTFHRCPEHQQVDWKIVADNGGKRRREKKKLALVTSLDRRKEKTGICTTSEYRQRREALEGASGNGRLLRSRDLGKKKKKKKNADSTICAKGRSNPREAILTSPQTGNSSYVLIKRRDANDAA